jgi:hypothetical protein
MRVVYSKYGLDLDTGGSAIGWAMEYFRRGISPTRKALEDVHSGSVARQLTPRVLKAADLC